MIFHLLAPPHRILTRRDESCAFTQKAFMLARLLAMDTDSHVHYYGHVSEDIMNLGLERISFEFSHYMYECKSKGLSDSFHERCSRNLPDSIVLHDFLLCTYGTDHLREAAIAKKKYAFVVESGIGYENQFADIRFFESESWRSVTRGRDGSYNNPNIMDRVIPNCVDTDRFVLGPEEKRGRYAAYIGRGTPLKGLDIAIEACAKNGIKLLIAGEPPTYDIGSAEYIGYIYGKYKVSFLQRAMFLIAPTRYIEPFGNVAIEAQACGTPVIASAKGAFTETVEHGKSGFLCNTQEDFNYAVDAMKGSSGLHSSKYIRNRIVNKYSMPVISKMYLKEFRYIYNYRPKEAKLYE